jgi:hypothetical protein
MKIILASIAIAVGLLLGVLTAAAAIPGSEFGQSPEWAQRAFDQGRGG